MPQSRSQGRSQSAHSPEPQQQQQRHESSELQEPHVAQFRFRAAQRPGTRRTGRTGWWTQQSGGREGQGLTGEE